MSIGHPIPEIKLFQNWPWKSKVKVMEEVNIESHNMGPTFCRLKSLSFHVNLPSHSWDTAFSKFDQENPRSRSWVKWTLKSQSGCNILSTHILFLPCQSAIPFLRYDFFKFWPWKSKVKVMGEVDIKSHSMGPTFYRLTSQSVKKSFSASLLFSKQNRPLFYSWHNHDFHINTFIHFIRIVKEMHKMSGKYLEKIQN